MKILFSGPEDIRDPFGKLTFGIHTLEYLGEVTGLPSMRIKCVVPQPEDASCVVYGVQCPHSQDDSRWLIRRCRTFDGLSYDNEEVVHTSSPAKWLGSTDITRNESDGSFLCLKWAYAEPEKTGFALWPYGSADGDTWEPLSDKPAYKDHDAFGLTWDPSTKEYVVYQATYQKHKDKPYPDNCGEDIRRVMHIRTSRDGVNWTPCDDVERTGSHMPDDALILPDERDTPELEFYRFQGFSYHDRYLGMMLNYAPSPSLGYPWSSHGPQLGGEWWISRDGRRWERPFRDVFAPGSAPGIVGHEPITLRGRHVWVIEGKAYGLPQDRIFYVGSMANAAFTTPPLKIVNPALPLLLNASFGFHGGDTGEGFRKQRFIQAELLDEDGKLIEGYEAHRSRILDIDAGYTRLWWGTASRLQRQGQTVRVRFHLRDARIYSLEAPGGDDD